MFQCSYSSAVSTDPRPPPPTLTLLFFLIPSLASVSSVPPPSASSAWKQQELDSSHSLPSSLLPASDCRPVVWPLRSLLIACPDRSAAVLVSPQSLSTGQRLSVEPPRFYFGISCASWRDSRRPCFSQRPISICNSCPTWLQSALGPSKAPFSQTSLYPFLPLLPRETAPSSIRRLQFTVAPRLGPPASSTTPRSEKRWPLYC